MPQVDPEKAAREKIDAMLTASGWLIQDYKTLITGKLCIPTPVCWWLL